ncbi:MAG: tyrosine-type recombinase/integrase [Candidatus Firestonebacteria bacterium]
MGNVRRRKDGKLYMDFRDGFGRRIRESVSTDDIKLARQILNKREVEVLEGKYFDKRKNEKIKFKDFANEVLEYLLKRRKAKGFFKERIKQLNEYFGEMFLYEITPRFIVSYQNDRVDIDKVSQGTVNRDLSVLRRIYNLGIKWGKISHNPVNFVEFYKESSGRVRFLTKEEIERLLANCYGYLKDIVKIALLTGMRKGEMLGLKMTNIDFNNNLIILDKTKNDEIREIPMSREVREILWRLCASKRKKDFIFVTKGKKRYSRNGVRTAFGTALSNAGIDNFRFHDLRHTFASHLVMSGVDIVTVQKLLGHKDIKMTMRYSHLAPKFKQDAIYKLEDSLNKKSNVANFGHDLGKFDVKELVAN